MNLLEVLVTNRMWSGQTMQSRDEGRTASSMETGYPKKYSLLSAAYEHYLISLMNLIWLRQEGHLRTRRSGKTDVGAT
jgi:hypothetical protein